MHDDTDAFAPPSEAPARTPLAGTVLLAWMMSGGVIGLAAGLTSQVLGFDPRVATPLGIGSIAAMTIAGGIALQVERARAKHRPAVLSERGRHERRAGRRQHRRGTGWRLGCPRQPRRTRPPGSRAQHPEPLGAARL